MTPTQHEQQYQLQTAPPQRASLAQRCEGLFGALLILVTLYIFGAPGAVLSQLRTAFVLRKPSSLLSPVAWRNAVVANGIPVLLRTSDAQHGALKRQAITPYAHGSTLEVGAGTGMTLKYYDAGKISKLFLVEPFVKLHAELRRTIADTPGLAGKTHIIPYGVEQREKLFAAGITPGSLDTVCLVQVLCSIPEPQKHLRYLQALLRSGGQLLLFEHVASERKATQTIQSLYNPVWTRLSGGCNVNRHSARAVHALGGWKDVVISRPAEENDGLLYPHVVGRFVKA